MRENNLNSTLRVLVILFFDVLGIYIVFALRWLSTGHSFTSLIVPDPSTIKATLPLVALMIPLMAYKGLYTKRLPIWVEIKKITRCIMFIFGLIITVLIAYDGGNVPISSLIPQMAIFGGMTACAVILLRIFAKWLLFSLGIGKERVMIIGAGKAGIAALHGLHHDKYMGYEVIGFLDDDPAKKGLVFNGVKVLGMSKYLPKFLHKIRFDTVMIAIPSLPREELTRFVAQVQTSAKKLLLVPKLGGVAMMNTELIPLFGERTFVFQINNNLKSPINLAIKKVSDVIMSILMLPVLLPLIGIIGLLIKLDSTGPVFYAHPRVGKNGKTVRVLKFRSMYKDAAHRLHEILSTDPEAQKEWDSSFKMKDDPRITKIGKFLRQTSLDELPQIFNVLRGEMSLVGPRPVVQAEIDNYYCDQSDYYFLIPPGITGLWQVSGRSDSDYDYRVGTDVWYVLNWSLYLDIIILCKTIRVVLKREGAY